MVEYAQTQFPTNGLFGMKKSHSHLAVTDHVGSLYNHGMVNSDL